MDPITMGLIIGGTGMAYNEFVEKPRIEEMNRKQAKAAAAQTQFSPWTNLGAGKANYQMPQSSLGAGLQNGMQGASFAQSYNAAEAQKNMADMNSPYVQSGKNNGFAKNGSADDFYMRQGWRV